MHNFLPIQRKSRLLISVNQVLLHASITTCAVAIAFSLPKAAQYILYQWWPKVVKEESLLIATEVGVAAILALLFNGMRIAWENRRKVKVAETAALVYARNEHRRWLTRWRERRLVKRLPAARDAYILTLTGFDTFSRPDSLLHEPLKSAYEVRVMLLHPGTGSAARRVASLPPEITAQAFREEVEATIDYLAALRTLGRKVTLKFYEGEPFWKIVVLGDHVWVQYCHGGIEVKHEPEYVFGLNHDNPRLGFFVPFYMYFLEHWSDPKHPEYDFDTCELVYRDNLGKEEKRVAFDGRDGCGKPALLAPKITASGELRQVTREAYANSG